MNVSELAENFYSALSKFTLDDAIDALEEAFRRRASDTTELFELYINTADDLQELRRREYSRLD